MSDTALEALPRIAAGEPAGGMVCCSADLGLAAASARIPWLRLIIGALVAAQTMLLGVTINLTPPDDRTTLLLLQGGMLAATLLVMALLGLPLAVEALNQLRQRRLTMELLFLLGIAASLGISLWSAIAGSGPVYCEVVNVLLVVYAAGHAITSHSRSRALAATQRMLHDVAQARMADALMREVTLIDKGDRVRVMPGEMIPVDGVVIAGQSLVRTTAFTGEWQSLTCGEGDAVLAGSACEDGTLVVEATAAGLDRRIDKLANLIASACQSTSPMQRLADRFVRVFLPAVTLVAIATLLYWGMVHHNWLAAIFNALAVILVACPCAAGLAVPLTTWTTISRLAEKGLLLKSADALQRLAMTQAVIFDKTGTLADERLELKELKTAPDPHQRQRTLSLLAAIERNSEHPVAHALRNLPGVSPADGIEVQAVRILPGRGIEADVVLDGRAAVTQLTRREGTELLTIDAALDGTWIATVSFAEALRESSTKAVEALKDMELPVQVMTGDSSGRTAADLAEVSSGKTPEQKHLAVSAATAKVLFVGDGVNDAAAMAASHSSIALASGSQIAIETADATLHGTDLTIIPEAISLARRAMATIRSNFAWAVGYNIVGMALAVSGVLHPVVAALLMMLSSSVVAWRSFSLSSVAPVTAPRSVAAPPAELSKVLPAGRSLPTWLFAALHLIGMLGQGAILILLARLGLNAAILVLAICAAVALSIIRLRAKLPAWADMTVGMLSIGGLGMNLGWWMDLHFSPAIQNGTVMACCMMRKTMEAAGPEASSHWMYWLMLIAGVPAMYILRRGPIYFDWRSWCCTGMLLLGVPGMCFGMWVGAQLAMHLENLSGQMQVVAAYVLMMAGMCAGMLVPHVLEIAWWPLSLHRQK